MIIYLKSRVIIVEMVKIFSIEGNIGSGKSTLVKILRESCPHFIYMLEPVDEWAEVKDSAGENILTKFYRNQEKYSFSFQMMAYISRLAKLKRLVQKFPKAIIITERSVLTDKNVFAKMLYDNNKIEEVNYLIYLKWFNEFIKEVPITGYIYVNVTPETSYKRVLKRNRQGEDIPLSYLHTCNQYHQKWLVGEKNVLMLDAEVDFEQDPVVQQKMVYKIDEFVKEAPKEIPIDVLNMYKYANFC